MRSKIEYLREENRTKTPIIKQLTENKAVSCGCFVVSTPRDHADKNKESVNSLESNERSNDLNPTKKLNEKTITDNHNTENKDANERNNKTIAEKKNDTENKDIKEDKNIKKKDTEAKESKENEDIKKKDKESKKTEKQVKNKTNGNHSPREKSKTVYIVGDSMIKKLNGCFLTKKVRHKYLIKIQSFSGTKVSCMVDHVKPN